MASLKKPQTILAAYAKTLLKSKRFGFLRDLRSAFPDSEVYLVGGAVRDILLGRETKDLDLVVRNVPLPKLTKILQAHGKVNLVGKKFGVLKFVPDSAKGEERDTPIDIALPREEYSLGHSGHYRDFAIVSNKDIGIEPDLSRRDFTINAMAFDLFALNLVDPFKGYADLSKKIIRAVGSPERRFEEDFSRMLRALRFHCQLGFKIEKHTADAIRSHIEHLHDEIPTPEPLKEEGVLEKTVRAVPYEVIAKEFTASFAADPLKAFHIYDDYDVFGVLCPEILAMKECPQPKEWHSEGDVWRHTELALGAITKAAFYNTFPDALVNAEFVITVLLHDIGKPYTIKTPEKDKSDRIRFDGHDHMGAKLTRSIAQRLTLSSPQNHGCDIERMEWLVAHHLLLISGDVKTMKYRTLEAYFFDDPIRGQLLQQLMWVDAKASLRQDGKTTLTKFKELQARLKEMRGRGTKNQLPAPLLDGHEVMKLVSLLPGPELGAILESLREGQLSGEIRTKQHARTWLKAHYGTA